MKKNTNYKIIFSSLIALILLSVTYFCLANINLSDEKINNIITKEQIENSDIDGITVFKYAESKRDDLYEFNYKIRTLEEEEGGNFKVIDKELYQKISSREWNDCRNSGGNENSCYSGIKDRIIDKIKIEKNSEKEKIENIKAKIKKVKNYKDFWAEFDLTKLIITDEELNDSNERNR